ncbi:MAG: putative lipid II flippase FtsW [Desulfomonilaceae bacterium]|nr:putative lipid II flippase FtsW [Desulfomonilaceae bacterium]
MDLAARLQPAPTTRRKTLGPDPFLLAVVVVILTIGIVMVTSASYIIAVGKYGDGFHYAKKQGLAMVIGLGAMYLFSMVNPLVWQRLAYPFMICGVVLLILVFVPGIGVEMGGSSRWLRLPFGFFLQPSEVIKYAIIIFFAHSLAKKGDGIRDFAVGFLPHLLVMGVVVLLVLMQPDFGTAVIITIVGFLMLFVAGVRLQHLLGSAILCLPLLIQVAISAQYRLSRIRSFLDPWSDPLNSGFQIIQSLIAFGCGGLWGVGIGQGLQKLGYLPQPHTDFVFSVVGEEIGFAGVLLLILLFYLLICRGLTVAIRSEDKFLRYVAFGITSLIGIQAVLNMAVSMGMLPTKGLPLPFVSLGGTSLVTNLAGLGILMAITRATQTETGEAKE